LRVKKPSRVEFAQSAADRESTDCRQQLKETVLPCQTDPAVKFSKIVSEPKNKVLLLYGPDKTCLMEIRQPLQQKVPENFSNLQECLGEDFKKILS
jgi:hypothetical protein